MTYEERVEAAAFERIGGIVLNAYDHTKVIAFKAGVAWCRANPDDETLALMNVLAYFNSHVYTNMLAGFDPAMKVMRWRVDTALKNWQESRK